MRKTLIYVVAGAFVLALLARAMTYTVRFYEAAVLTTFGSAEASAKQTEPGLKFKWPDPIQSVTKYDTRLRLLQTRLETQQTADSRQLVVEAFANWRVADPLVFFKKFSSSGPSEEDHYRRAEEVLRDSLRAAMGEISRFSMRELFTTDAAGSKLPELESAVLAALRRSGEEAGGVSAWGIEVVAVGINRVLLPEETSREVVNSMKSDRERLIRDLESRGAALEESIRSTAEANARKIEQFALAYAQEIRRQGDLEAEQFVKRMNESPELAVFLKNMEFIREVMAQRITFIFNTGMPGFQLLSPGIAGEAASGRVPGTSGLMGDPAAPLMRATERERRGEGGGAGGGEPAALRGGGGGR